MIPASETYEQWCDRLAANRKAQLESELDRVERERLEALDAVCGAVDQFVGQILALEVA